jgi:DNA-binding LytR/AlgR family response regulator
MTSSSQGKIVSVPALTDARPALQMRNLQVGPSAVRSQTGEESNIRFSIGQVLSDERVTALEAATAEEVPGLAAEHSPDVILLDIRWGEQSGLDVFRELREIDPKSLVIFIAGHGTADTAIEAMKTLNRA